MIALIISAFLPDICSGRSKADTLSRVSSMATPDSTRALIVDDDPVVGRAIARRMLREGYTISLAQTCRGARAAGPGFQVAILDLDLPDGSGVDLADELLRLGAVRSVVFYTGSLDHALRERAIGFGALLDKASDLEEVVRAADRVPRVPTVSHFPAARMRGRSSRSRLSRVAADSAPHAEAATTKRSSRG